jgi:hypothetical protein
MRWAVATASQLRRHRLLLVGPLGSVSLDVEGCCGHGRRHHKPSRCDIERWTRADAVPCAEASVAQLGGAVDDVTQGTKKLPPMRGSWIFPTHTRRVEPQRYVCFLDELRHVNLGLWTCAVEPEHSLQHRLKQFLR